MKWKQVENLNILLVFMLVIPIVAELSFLLGKLLGRVIMLLAGY